MQERPGEWVIPGHCHISACLISSLCIFSAYIYEAPMIYSVIPVRLERMIIYTIHVDDGPLLARLAWIILYARSWTLQDSKSIIQEMINWNLLLQFPAVSELDEQLAWTIYLDGSCHKFA